MDESQPHERLEGFYVFEGSGKRDLLVGEKNDLLAGKKGLNGCLAREMGSKDKELMVKFMESVLPRVDEVDT